MNEVIHIKAFGMVAEKIGTTELAMGHYPDSEALLAALQAKFPVLKSIKFSLAINRKLISAKQEIPGYAEIALLPPFSGG